MSTTPQIRPLPGRYVDAAPFDPNDVAAMPGQYLNIVIYGCSVGLLLLLISRPVTRLMGGVR